MRGSSPNEKQHALQSRDALKEKIMDKIITLDITGLEKYGRILATVYYKGENMNEWLLKNNYAIPYDGGTKKRDPTWDQCVSNQENKM